MGAAVRVRYDPAEPRDASVLDPAHLLRLRGLAVLGVLLTAWGVIELSRVFTT